MELSQAGQNQLDSQNIRLYREVKICRDINGYKHWTAVNVTGHSISYDKEFGTAKLDFTVANPDGDYCREALSDVNYVGDVYRPLLDDENEVIFRQGFINEDNEVEWIEEEVGKGRFWGLISQVSEGHNSIQVSCQDAIKQLLDSPSPVTSYIPEIYEVLEEELVPDYTSGNDAYKVYTLPHKGLVPVPGPEIFARSTTDPNFDKDVYPDYYEVNIHLGKIIFYENPMVNMPFWWLGAPGKGSTVVEPNIYGHEGEDEEIPEGDRKLVCSYYYYGDDSLVENLLVDVARRSRFDMKRVFHTVTSDDATNGYIVLSETPQVLVNGSYFVSAYMNGSVRLSESEDLAYDYRYSFDPLTNRITFGRTIVAGDIVSLSYCSPVAEKLIENKTGIELWEHPRTFLLNDVGYGGRVFVSPNYPYENLVSGNSTVYDNDVEVTPDYVDWRRGAFYLPSIPSGEVTADIEAYTIKGTGISLPAIEFPPGELKNSYEAVQEVRKSIAPNYLIYADSQGKCRGHYSWQKGSPQIIEYGTDATGGLVSDNSSYIYALTALNADGETLASRELRIVATDATDTQVNWIWIEPLDGATSYRLYRRRDGCSFATNSLVAEQASTYFEDDGSGLLAGKPPFIDTAHLGYDHKLTLVKDISPKYSDEQVYTHVIAMGKAFSISNLLNRSGTEMTLIDPAPEGAIFPTADQLKLMKDNNPETQAIWHFNKPVTYPVDLLQIKLDREYFLDSLHLYARDHAGVYAQLASTPKLDIYASLDGTNWRLLSNETSRFDFRPWEWHTFERDSFGVLGAIQYLKFEFTDGGLINMEGTDTTDWRCTFAEIKVYGTPEYGEEVGVIAAHAYSVPGRVLQYGEKIKVLDIDSLLWSNEQVQRRADDYLREAEKNRATYNVSVVYSPHLALGETVLLDRTRINRKLLCYIEGITDSQRGLQPTVDLVLANYDSGLWGSHSPETPLAKSLTWEEFDALVMTWAELDALGLTWTEFNNLGG